MNPLKSLGEYGQSVWLDYIRRSLLTGGDLKRLVEEDGLRGVTSNPSIFQKAITGSTDYTTALNALAVDPRMDGEAVYERLALEDIRMAADILLPVYGETRGRDGYVSLEVSPRLARDTEGTCREARRLWKAIGRENVMIKVPGTPEGIPAVETLIGEGIHVNVTLLFSREVYEEVVEAYLRGLERRLRGGGDLGKVASVASFFLSRIDAAIGSIASVRLARSRSQAEKALFRSILGKVAVANGKLAYHRYRELFAGKRWRALEREGARTQRLLWASTSTKDPSFRDVLYVEELIGPDTVTTIPPATYEAFREHGRVGPTLERDLEEAHGVMAILGQLDIPMHGVTDRLLQDGLRLFTEAFDKLLLGVETARRAASVRRARARTFTLPRDLAAKVDAAIEDWRAQGKVRRLWSRDASLWTGRDERDWLGWLGITEDPATRLETLRGIADEVKEGGFLHALLLGMGGSSLCPEVLKGTFGRLGGHPELFVLDSTDPARIRTLEGGIDPARTLFIVSSKSGTTLEPDIFHRYFFDRVRERIGREEAGSRFIAITDPGSPLQRLAEENGFRRICLGLPSIGGRYSALSDFGMVPAAIMGVDVARLLDRAEEMVEACAGCVPAPENPGVVLGAVLGVLAGIGRDKVTLIASPGIRGLGAWLEQLLAESTGKQGRALVPVDGERLGPPEVYGDDRVFVYLRLESAPEAAQDSAVSRLEEAGQPVVRISLEDPYDLGREFFRWEFATAVAGSVMGLHPFDQPDVEATKAATRRLTAGYETAGSLPPEFPVAESEGIRLFADERNAADLARGAGGSLAAFLKAHLDRLREGDYFALLAYLEMNETHQRELESIRHAVRDAKRVATCLGFGPRYLHSTGQAHKGGPNTGVFLLVTCDDAEDLPVPGRKYTFGVVKAAQARGDLQVLAERRRRVVRVHLSGGVPRGLGKLRERIQEALR